LTEKNQNWAKSVQNIDNLWIFAILLVLIVLPLFVPLNLPVRPSAHSANLYDKIESLEPGDVVVLDFSWHYGFKMLHQPAHVAITNHLFSKPGVKIVMTAFFNPSSELSFRDTMLEVNPEVNFPDKEYGKDWIWLGYVTGREAAVLNFCDDPWGFIPVDKYGTSISEYPDFFEGISDASDFALAIEGGGHGGINGFVTGGFLKGFGLKYQTFLAMNMDPACIAEFYPYYPDTIQSLINGNKGAAEYEALMGEPGFGYKLMDTVSTTGLFAVGLIILANVGFIIDTRKEEMNA
jgi:hypothetical protein